MSLSQLRDRLVAAGCNKHDQVDMLITACIGDGIDEGSAILRTIAALGYDQKHVGILLNDHTGSNSSRHCWFKDKKGRYRLHS